MSPERSVLNARLKAMARRLRLLSGLDGARIGLFAGALLALGAVLLSKLVPSLPAAPLAGLLAATGLAAGFVASFLRPVPLRVAAIQADLSAGTEEVISTACELHDDSFSRVIEHRAVRLLESLPKRSFLPRRSGKPWILPVLLAAAAAALLPVPALRLAGGNADKTVSLSALKLQKIESDARKLRKIAEETGSRELNRLQAEMKRMAQALRNGDLTQKEALAKLAELSREAESIRKDLDEKQKGLESLAKSPEAKSLAEAASRSDAGEAAKQAKELAGKLASGALSEKSKESLRSSLGELSKSGNSTLADAASKASEALDRGDAQALEKEMGRIAEGLKGGSLADSSPGNEGKQDSGNSPGSEELKEALSDLDASKDELSGNENLASGEKEFCPECGKREPSEGGG